MANKIMKIIGPEGAQVVAFDYWMTIESDERLRERITFYSGLVEQSPKDTPNLDRARRDAELILADRKYGKER